MCTISYFRKHRHRLSTMHPITRPIILSLCCCSKHQTNNSHNKQLYNVFRQPTTASFPLPLESAFSQNQCFSCSFPIHTFLRTYLQTISAFRHNIVRPGVGQTFSAHARHHPPPLRLRLRSETRIPPDVYRSEEEDQETAGQRLQDVWSNLSRQ